MQLLSAADFSLTDEKDNKMFCDNQPSTSASRLAKWMQTKTGRVQWGTPGIGSTCSVHSTSNTRNLIPPKNKTHKILTKWKKGICFYYRSEVYCWKARERIVWKGMVWWWWRWRQQRQRKCWRQEVGSHWRDNFYVSLINRHYNIGYIIYRCILYRTCGIIYNYQYNILLTLLIHGRELCSWQARWRQDARKVHLWKVCHLTGCLWKE